MKVSAYSTKAQNSAKSMFLDFMMARNLFKDRLGSGIGFLPGLGQSYHMKAEVEVNNGQLIIYSVI